MEIKVYRTGILIVLLLTMMCGIAQAAEPTLESNVEYFLNEAGLRKTVKIEGITKDGSSIRAIPIEFKEDGMPLLVNEMETTPSHWREIRGVLIFGDRLFHPGRWKSFHSAIRPSLHVVVFREQAEEGQYRYRFLIHFDRYVPTVTGFRETFKHIALEVIPHTIFGKRTSQYAIKQAIEQATATKAAPQPANGSLAALTAAAKAKKKGKR
jgi:hypothetical protein